MLDAFTGEILAELDRLNLSKDTLVIFTSDHGEMVGGHGVVTKYSQMYDEVLRVPLVIRWPDHITPGSVEPSFVSHVDYVPTFAERAGGPPPIQTHGQSWANVTKNEPLSTPREAVYAQLHGWGGASWYSLRMVRTRDWKYVFSPYAPEELYDLINDPAENHNRANELPEQVTIMRGLLKAEMEAVQDPLARHPDLKTASK